MALIENARGGVAELEGLTPDQIPVREPQLLLRAKQLCAKLPFKKIDIGVVERIGKDISGTGMDCYVVGRKRIAGEDEWPEAPQISSLVVLDLTEATHGNAVGIGLADFSTQRLARQIDWVSTQANVLTSGNVERGKLPFVFPSDRETIEVAAYRERTVAIGDLRVVVIPDTLHLGRVLVSKALAEESRQRDDLEIVGGPADLPFDASGDWLTPFAEV